MRIFIKHKLFIVGIMVSLLCFCCGCNNDDSVAYRRVIAGDDPWWSDETFEYGKEYASEETSITTMASNGEKTVLYVVGNTTNMLLVCEDQNSQEINLSEYGSPAVSCVFINENTIYVILRFLENSEAENIVYELDEHTGTLEELFDLSFDENEGNDTYVSRVIPTDEKMYIRYSYLENNLYRDGFEIVDYDGNNEFEISVGEGISDWTVLDSGEIIYRVREFDEIGNDARYYRLDGVTGSLTEYYINDEVADKYLTAQMFDDGSMYLKSTDMSIMKYDFSTGVESEFFNFNDCNVNMNWLLDMSYILYCEEDTIVFEQNTFLNTEYFYCSLEVLKKESTNPNAGKQTLILAPVYIVDYFEGEAIRKFNSEERTSYIYVTGDYSIYNESETYDVSDYLTYHYSQISNIEDRLSVDIKASDGPDIIMGAGELSQIENDELLVDVNEIVDGNYGINRSEFFDNVFDAYTVEGKMYRMPYVVSVQGIVASEDTVESGTKGLTYGEYRDYVDEICSGVDPLTAENDRDMIFELLFSCMTDCFFEEGYLNIDNDEFRNLAEFVKSNYSGVDSSGETFKAKQVCLSDVGWDIADGKIMNSGNVLLGYPSGDGRGATVFVNETLSVTKCCNNRDDAMDFIAFVLSYDVQKLANKNPINIKAFQEYASSGLDYANTYYEQFYGKPGPYDSEYVECYIRMIESAEVSCVRNSDVWLAVAEEMPAYFEGDKTLDDVIPIINQRVNNMIDERK